MRKKLLLLTMPMLVIAIAGCGANAVTQIPEQIQNVMEQNEFAKDYEPVIEKEVKEAEVNSPTLQEELAEVEKTVTEYENKVQAAENQQNMNQAERWPLEVWETEMGSLKARINELGDDNVKTELMNEQVAWVKMMDEVTVANIGTREQSGSIYPTLRNELWAELTRNRAYILAAKLAAVKGESFEMPERFSRYGTYADTQGTDSIYSMLVLKSGWEQDEAEISVFRTGRLEGTFLPAEVNEYTFISNDGNVKGTIRTDGWNGASFEVTEVKGDSPFAGGDRFEFRYVF